MSLSLKVQSYSIPLRSSFKHHTAERKVTETILVAVERGGLKGYGEACPRSYVTGETVEGAITWIESKANELTQLKNLAELKLWQEKLRAQIDGNLAAFCAVELALLDLFAKEANVTVEQLLGLPKISGTFQYSAVVSDEHGEKLSKILTSYLAMGFHDFKFKLSSDLQSDKAKFQMLEKLAGAEASKLRVRIDANNIWPQRPKDAIQYIRALERNFFGIEEPLSPHEWNGLSQLSTELDTPVILDESLLTVENLEMALTLPGQWIPNIRVSKVGGIQRSLKIADVAAKANCKIIVGAQVGETSILSRAALTVVQAYRSFVTAQEGAYGTLLIEKDLADPEIRFGDGGVLNWTPQGNGLGLNISSP